MATLSLGFHCGGEAATFDKALSEAHRAGATVVQVFLKDNQSHAARCAYTPEQTTRIRECLQGTGLKMVVHGSYIINLAHPPASHQARSGVELIVDDAVHLGAMTPVGRTGLLVIHVGKSKTGDVGEATRNFVNNARAALARMPENVCLLVETAAGQGTEMFTDPGELVGVVAEIGSPRVGICFDTCHVFSTGVNVSRREVMSKTLETLMNGSGNFLKLVHLNDSQLPCGSRRDRHESLGRGHLFDIARSGSLEGLQTLCEYAKRWDVPVVLETPSLYHQDEGAAVRCIADIPLPPHTTWDELLSTAKGVAPAAAPCDGDASADETETQKDSPSVNANIANILEKLGNTQTNPFKKKAYFNAASSIRGVAEPLRSGAQAARLPGVGKAIAEKIEEIIKTGTLHQYEDSRKELEAVERLSAVSGIGPSTALKLFRDHGIETVPQLVEATKAGKIKLTKAQAAALTHHEDILKRIPREEMDLYAAEIRSAAQAIDAERLETVLVGSYRRGQASSGDIDVLVRHQDVKTEAEAGERGAALIGQMLEELAKRKILQSILSKGKKAMLIVKLPDRPSRRLDILLTATESFPAALLYFTGSKEFNVNMRIHAQTQGFKLNEYGLWNLHDNTLVSTNSERAIFETIGMEFVPPKGRIAVPLNPSLFPL